ncbi:hypothetical protein FE633_17890, partial [Streptomyces montanus]
AASVPGSSGGGMSGTNPTAGPTTGGGMGGGPGGAPGGGRGGFPGGTANGGQAPGNLPSGAQTGTGRPGGMAGGAAGGPGGGADAEMIAYLKKHRDGAKWLVAVSGSQSAAQLIVSSREPVISMWGWTGTDKAMTLTKLKELVKKGELHYVMLGGGMDGGGGRGGSDSTSAEVTAWVQKNGTDVEASQNTQALYRLDASDVN